jgi:hypothetical protein
VIIELVRKTGSATMDFTSVKELGTVTPHWFDGDTSYAPDEYHVYDWQSPYGGVAATIHPRVTDGSYALYVDLGDGSAEFVGTFATVLDAAKAYFRRPGMQRSYIRAQHNAQAPQGEAETFTERCSTCGNVRQIEGPWNVSVVYCKTCAEKAK